MTGGYVIDDSVQHTYVSGRDARTFLPFLLTHLRAGMDVLDVGCGVGSIALDIARRIAPGRIVGIDRDGGQLEVARVSAEERSIGNAEFLEGAVDVLAFDDAAFDVVYANAVLQHVPEPVHVLKEMRRVLRPGGLAAVSDDDVDTFVISPERPELRRAAELFGRAIVHAGGNPRYSRHLRTLLREAGFARTQGFAVAPEVYGDEESTRWFADFVTGAFAAPRMADVIVQQGWATRAELEETIDAVREWGAHPDAFATWLYCAAVGCVD
jgi:ubiquinone/menaquinone biosynthesis C-methylase UbiE